MYAYALSSYLVSMLLPISVIIPTYNRAQVTGQALLSVYRQTQLPSEIYILDDGSNPTEFANLQRVSAHVINQAKEMNPQANQAAAQIAKVSLQVQRLPRHLGMPGAVRNIAIQRSSQPWLAFLDSDDIWLEQKLEQQWQRAQQSTAKIIHCRELWLRFSLNDSLNNRPNNFLEDNKQAQFPPQFFQKIPSPELILPPYFPANCQVQIISQKKHKHPREGRPQQIWPAALKKCIIGPSTLLMQRSVCREVGYFEPKIQIAEDYEYFLRLTARFDVAYCPEYLIAKRDSMPIKIATNSQNNSQAADTMPQLSHQYSWIEPFRISALETLLLSTRGKRLLTNGQQQQAISELQRKLNICLAGAYKRAAKQTNPLEQTEWQNQNIQQAIQAEIKKLETKRKFWSTTPL